MSPSIWQLLIVLVIIILIFGTKKLRNMGGDLGGAMKNFKSAINDDDKKKSEEDDTRVIEGSAETEVNEQTQSQEQVHKD